MLILAMDTTSEHGGVALFRDRDCVASIAHEGAANAYSVALFQMVDQVVAQARDSAAGGIRTQRDIELYAVATGPGSFTGIRVGLAAAQAWARVFNRPVRGVSVLEALVEAAEPETRNAVPLLNAYRGEFYIARFQRTTLAGGPRFLLEGEGHVLNPQAVREFLAKDRITSEDVTCIARAHDQAAMALRESLPESLGWKNISGTLLKAIAGIGHRAAQEGKLQTANELDAYYIRRLDAELKWKG